jgi:16S rRNA (cytidine1402-2'-O)-methyltransferase
MTDSPIKLFMIPTILAEGTQEAVLSPQILRVIGELDVFFVEIHGLPGVLSAASNWEK